MLEYLKQEADRARTANGGAAYAASGSAVLDLFAAAGALRQASEDDILRRFDRAWGEDPALTLRLLFWLRDVREGLGERRVFRVMLRHLANTHPAVVRRNLDSVPDFGRWDDLLCLLRTGCHGDVIALIRRTLREDLEAEPGQVSLLAKWLPSVNASSPETVAQAKTLARALGWTDRTYRKTLSTLRERLRLVENDLRTGRTPDFDALPSKALLKYRKAFLRNNRTAWRAWLAQVRTGGAVHAGTLVPYELLRPFFRGTPDEDETEALETLWNALPGGETAENALVVLDGSGSMESSWRDPSPACVGQSLALYYAERARGPFAGHFITFSKTPQLVKLRGRTLGDRLRYCRSFHENANTDLAAVFDLLLRTAVRHRVPQTDLPERLYVITDLEFDRCADNADATCFERARAAFAAAGYRLPEVVFWNVQSPNAALPVRKNDAGAALVSGNSPRLFSLLRGPLEPEAVMRSILNGARYASIQ